MFEVRELSFRYSKNIPLLHNISFHLQKGLVLGLLGHNGSGKSTLLKLMGGLLLPHTGDILLMEKPLKDWNRANLYTELSMMIEEPSFYKHLSIWDNFRILSFYHQSDSTRIPDLLEQVGMYKFKDRKVSKLSTGMKQRIGLAAALLPDPQILLLDEPTNGMDPEGIIEIRQMVRRLADSGKTIIISSHLLSEMEKIADQVLILKNGEAVFYGPIQNLKGQRDLESIYMDYA